jgi:hypothetical protein
MLQSSCARTCWRRFEDPNQDGNVRAVGAEAVREGIEDDAEDNQWTKLEWQGVTLPLPSPSMWLIED